MSTKSATNTSKKNTQHTKKKPKIPKKPIYLSSKYLSIKKQNKITHIDRFKHRFEILFQIHDEIEMYYITNDMIKPYLELLIDRDVEYIIPKDKLYSIWQTILKDNRYLLYLDQFISIDNFCKTNGVNTGKCNIDEYINEITNHPTENSSNQKQNTHTLYFELPTAQIINKEINAKKIPIDQKSIGLSYSHLIYKQMDNIITKNMKNINTMSTINDVLCITAHGQIGEKLELIKVPPGMVIAFISPLNKLTYGDIDVFKIINNYLDDANFYKNPACYFRSNNCLKHTTYYYPGQYAPNSLFEYDTSIELEKTKMGVFNRTGKIDDQLFINLENGKYQITLNMLVNTKMKYLKNKIIYINCCRTCDFNLPHKEIEFLYRYEHIINYLNISNCDIFKGNIIKGCQEDTFNKYDERGIFTKSGNNTKQKWFFDSALSYTFNTNDIKKTSYLSFDDDKWLQVLDKINELDTKKQILYLNSIILFLLNQLTDDTADLYSDRIIELLDRIKYKSNLIYHEDIKDNTISPESTSDEDSYLYMWVKNYDILTKIYDVFSTHNVPFEKFKRVYKILLALADEEENRLLYDTLVDTYDDLTA